MRVRGYGVRPSNNGYSGHKNSGDEFNRDYKQVRYVRAEEYATRDVQEYHHYPEQKDVTKDDDNRDDISQEDKSRKQKNSSKSRIQALQQVVVGLVGAAVIATSYQVAMAKRAEAQTDDPSSSASQSADNGSENPAFITSWEWGENNESAVLIISDSSGKVIARIPATVTTVEEAAGCTTTGKMIYTAKAEYEGNPYTDSREKELPALGHSFDDGKETTLENGKTAVDFTCERCGEHFIIQNSLDEE